MEQFKQNREDFKLLRNQRIPSNLKKRFHKTIIRPSISFLMSEVIKKLQDHKFSTAKIISL